MYCNRLGFVDFESARQSKIEAADTREGPVDLRSEEQVKQHWLRTGSDGRSSAPSGQGEDEDRFDKVAASRNSQNLNGSSITSRIGNMKMSHHEF